MVVLRRYRRRWRVERLSAWLHHFRRLVIRWEYHVENFFGTVRLGCMQILLRYLCRLLVAQRHYGVDLSRAACREVASQQCGRYQKQNHCSKSCRIGCRHAKKQRLQRACDGEGTGKSGGGADENGAQSVAQYHRENISGAGAQSHPYANLVCTAAD